MVYDATGKWWKETRMYDVDLVYPMGVDINVNMTGECIITSAVSVTVKKLKPRFFRNTEKTNTEVFLDATNGFEMCIFR